MSEFRSFKPLYTPAASSVNTFGQGATTGGSFSPTVNVTTVAATAVASTVLPGTLNNDQCQILVANQTVSWVLVNFGILGSVTAASLTVGVPIAPNSEKTITVDREVTGASVFLPTGGTVGTVSFTRGVGL